MRWDCGIRAALTNRRTTTGNKPVSNKRKRNDWENLANDTFGKSNAAVNGVMVWSPTQSVLSKTVHLLNRRASRSQQRYTASSTHQEAAVIEVETLPKEQATNRFKALQLKYQPDGAQDGVTPFNTAPVRSWSTNTTKHFAIIDDPLDATQSIILRRDLRVPLSPTEQQ